MPKTNTEIIRELDRTVPIIQAHIERLKADLVELKESHVKVTETIGNFETRIALLQQPIDETRKRQDEYERRFWWFFTVLVVSLLTLIVSLIVIIAKPAGSQSRQTQEASQVGSRT